VVVKGGRKVIQLLNMCIISNQVVVKGREEGSSDFELNIVA
jgi:hypothetical protein